MQLAIFRSQSAQYVQNMYVGTMEISASEPRGAAWNAKRRRPETPASPQPPVNPQLALALLPCNVVNAASSNSKAIRLPTPEVCASLLPPPPVASSIGYATGVLQLPLPGLLWALIVSTLTAFNSALPAAEFCGVAWGLGH